MQARTFLSAAFGAWALGLAATSAQAVPAGGNLATLKADVADAGASREGDVRLRLSPPLPLALRPPPLLWRLRLSPALRPLWLLSSLRPGLPVLAAPSLLVLTKAVGGRSLARTAVLNRPVAAAARCGVR